MNILIIITSLICIIGISLILFLIKLKSILNLISNKISELNNKVSSVYDSLEKEEQYRNSIESEINLIRRDMITLFSQVTDKGSKHQNKGIRNDIKETFQSDPKIKTTATDLNKKKIMIAEDTEYNYLLLEAILKEDYHLLRAVNGIEAVEYHQSENPDIILMDIKMPELDGLQATEKIREKDQSTPIIAVTAYAFDGDIERAMNLGCTDYLTKPVNTKKLKQILNKYLA